MKPTPYVSVIIPTYRSESVIGGCLESLCHQTYQNFEVIIVNSYKDTKTRREVEKAFPRAKFIQHHQRLLPQDAKGLGITWAKGDLLAFIDPDCRARRDWLQTLVNRIEKGKAFVGGSMENHYHTWIERGIHLCKFHDVLVKAKCGPLGIIPFSNACLKKEAWENIGPFTPNRYCSDGILSWQARDSGCTPWLEPKAVVEHIHGENIRLFLRKRFFRGKEFAGERISYEKWSKKRIAANLFFTPFLIFWVLLRCFRNAVKSGKTRVYFSTLPIQIFGQSAWIVGEAFTCERVLRGKTWNGEQTK